MRFFFSILTITITRNLIKSTKDLTWHSYLEDCPSSRCYRTNTFPQSFLTRHPLNSTVHWARMTTVPQIFNNGHTTVEWPHVVNHISSNSTDKILYKFHDPCMSVSGNWLGDQTSGLLYLQKGTPRSYNRAILGEPHCLVNLKHFAKSNLRIINITKKHTSPMQEIQHTDFCVLICNGSKAGSFDFEQVKATFYIIHLSKLLSFLPHPLS